MKIFIRLGIMAMSVVMAASSFASLTVGGSSNSTTLANAGLGALPAGVTFTGSTYNGASLASGTYSGLSFAPLTTIPSGLIMTTGDATVAVGSNNADSAGSSNGGPTASFTNYDGVNSISLFDVATLTINFNVKNATNLAFDFSYGSEEYYYYTNSPYNDSFFAFLDAGTKTLALDKNGKAITINNQFLTIDNRPDTFSPSNGYGLPDKPGAGTAAGIAELQYDGFTPVLRTSFDVTAGDHSLTFVIGDAGDTVLDSGVFISNVFGPGSGKNDDTEPVPEPCTLIVLLGASSFMAARGKRRAH